MSDTSYILKSLRYSCDNCEYTMHDVMILSHGSKLEIFDKIPWNRDFRL
jgi:hypothetical protein